eukprot:TRINITY_DN68053_c13_g2_i1.p1 TRINITY_DN68053_c13_g2~~TRINITY_DN68053_c13_g2_i1.p1  ORF type:complete len:510 (+),score=285.46 TRINITY_DN68053_c13_g2_i1:27-1556(+)
MMLTTTTRRPRPRRSARPTTLGLVALVGVVAVVVSCVTPASAALSLETTQSIDALTANMIESDTPFGPLIHALRINAMPNGEPILLENRAWARRRADGHRQQGTVAPNAQEAAPKCESNTQCPVKGWTCCGPKGDLCCPKDMQCVAAQNGQLPFCTPHVHLDEKAATPAANATWQKENEVFRENFKKRTLREEFSKQQEEHGKGTLNSHEEEVKNYKTAIEEKEKQFEKMLEERWKAHGKDMQVHMAGDQQQRKDLAAQRDKEYEKAKHKEELLKSRYFLEVQSHKVDRKSTCMLHWRQSSRSSNGWLDASGNNNHAFMRRDAKLNKDGSLNVRGTFQHAVVKYSDTMVPKSAKHPKFSVEVWFKPRSLSVTNGGGILFAQEGSLYLELGANGHLQVMVPGTKPNGFIVSKNAIKNKHMTHVAYAFDGKQHVLYLNGEVDTTRKPKHIGKPARTSHLISLGALHSHPEQRKFRGDIYAVRYYNNYALQASDVVARWQFEAPKFKIKLKD